MIQLTREGDADAQQALFQAIYGELRVIAARIQRDRRTDRALQPTALAHEAYLVLERRFPPPPKTVPESRYTFYRSVAFAMRTIVRDEWRRAKSQKRGGGRPPVPLDAVSEHASEEASPQNAIDMLMLDAAMSGLEHYNPRWFDVVLHHFYGGRTFTQIADLIGVSERTVRRDWTLARGWLKRALGAEIGDTRSLELPDS
ncbi:MAG: sigma-70 family RNA polymerase sigma factor [Planctomycetes bacterium]|nr:sigma-70 family RNA polymerase sigma factor [Planctomycetota bacterium]